MGFAKGGYNCGKEKSEKGSKEESEERQKEIG